MHTGYRSYGASHAIEYAPGAKANIIVCVSIESPEGPDDVEAVAAVEDIARQPGAGAAQVNRCVGALRP